MKLPSVYHFYTIEMVYIFYATKIDKVYTEGVHFINF